MVLLQRRFLRQPPWVANELWRRARAVPSLDLRFADTKSLTDAVSGQNLITFTRASSGTYVGSDGFIKTAAANEPRFDHNPTTGESLGLLVEEQRTNLLVRSEEFDSGSWTKTASTVTANAIAAPNGTTTADLLVPDTSNSTHYIQAAASVTNGTSYTFSVYAKSSGSLSKIVLSAQYVSLFQLQAVFDLASGTISSKLTQATAQITSMGNGWYRCSVTATSSDAGTVSNPMRIFPETASSYTGDGTSGIYIWGAQLEVGSFPTSYIPTTSATVTRTADVASITGANFTRWYRQDEMTVYAAYLLLETTGNAASNRTILYTDNGSGGSRMFYLAAYSGSAARRPRYFDDSTTDMFPVSTSNKFAVALATDNNAACIDNGVITSDITGSPISGQARAAIGSYAAISSVGFFNGTLSRLTYWQSRLPNSTLQDLTR